MKEKVTSVNLKLLRKTKDFSQERLAEKSGLSLSVYQSIECGKSEPPVSSLRAIAASLDVPIQRLVEPVRSLTGVRFRSNRQMRNREQILVDVARWLGNFVEIEDILDDHVPYRFKNIPSLVEARKHREDRGKIVADLVRKELGLGEEEANSFASSFLMPDASFQKEWKKTSGLALVDRVMKIKRIFNVSYRAVLLVVRPA